MAGARCVPAREPADPHARPRRRTHFRGDRRMPVSENLATPKLPPVDPLPLTGLRVLDLTLARAGPTCVRHLADWGADIIRVEPPAATKASAARATGSTSSTCTATSAHRARPEDPDGHAAFLKLVKTADVLVENMRAQVKHRLKIAYDDLKPLNPRLVYASISGFGQTGPYCKAAASTRSRRAWAGSCRSPASRAAGRCAWASRSTISPRAICSRSASCSRCTSGRRRAWAGSCTRACWRRRSSCWTSRPAAI